MTEVQAADVRAIVVETLAEQQRIRHDDIGWSGCMRGRDEKMFGRVYGTPAHAHSYAADRRGRPAIELSNDGDQAASVDRARSR